MILSTSYNHGGHYHFRIHRKKTDELCSSELKGLNDYMMVVRKDCPEEYFLKGPRSSVLKIDIKAPLQKMKHEVSGLARMGLDSGYYDNAHMNVQMFMLAYDKKTVAIEIPIWLEPSEYKFFREFFDSEYPLTGHIDLIRIEDGKIWIWDYKPNAHREKFASTQTYFYALMLSKRTKVPLKHFMCGYFDDKNVFVFDPSEIKIQ